MFLVFDKKNRILRRPLKFDVCQTGYLLSTDRKFILTCKSLKEIEKMEPDTISKKKLLNMDVFSLWQEKSYFEKTIKIWRNLQTFFDITL